MTYMEIRPLENKTIAITRAAQQFDEFASLLAGFGAQPLCVPVIEIKPVDSPAIDRVLEKINSYQWIIFTSGNGVDIFLPKVKQFLSPADMTPRICAIGPGTADRIARLGFRADLIPKLFQAEGIITELEEELSRSPGPTSILIPRAAKARKILPEALRAKGALVDVIPVYQTIFPERQAPQLRDLMVKKRPDMVTFTSSSTVTNFIRLAGNSLPLNRYEYASIGPITSATARKAGVKVAVDSQESTLKSLTEAIVNYYKKKDSAHRTVRGLHSPA